MKAHNTHHHLTHRQGGQGQGGQGQGGQGQGGQGQGGVSCSISRNFLELRSSFFSPLVFTSVQMT